MFSHNYDFDPTYGHDLSALLKAPGVHPPTDFADFWQQTYDEARAVPLCLETQPSRLSNTNVQVLDVAFNAWGDVRIGGWVVVPRNESIERGLVVGHGYGGREAPSLELPLPRTAAIFPCARGFHRSARCGLPNSAARHVLHGIRSRDTYIHRGCVADLWAAASALLHLYPQVAGRLDYAGGSFGGGIGAMALPWDDRFRRAHLTVPSFGNHALRLKCPCTGSGEAVRIYHRRRPQVAEVLAYFDAAAARFVKIPVAVSAALFDPAVPPPGQFAVYNALGGEKSLNVLSAGHFEYPPQQAVEQRQTDAFMADWFSQS